MPDSLFYDLRTQPLISVEQGGTRVAMSLAGVLASLSRGEEIEFPALRAHQQHPWHAFVCQLGALASGRHLGGEFPTAEEPWQVALLALSQSEPSAWHLLVTDLSRPAFFQPPVPEGTLDKFSLVATPDELDVLVTSKNHDVKRAQVRQATAELWMLALLTLQTFQGFSGRDNYGIARMNSGFGNRPGVAVTASLGWSQRWQHDTRRLLREVTATSEAFGFAEHGLALLWLEPWDGQSSLTIDRCSPLFLEVCRRVRFARRGARIEVYATSSRVPRVEAKDRNGCLGDAWTPTKIEDPPAALNVSEEGFSYRRTQALLFGEGFQPAPAQELPPGTGRLFFLAQALSRGQGKTQGYHERIVPIPPRVRVTLGQKSARDRLAQLSQQRIKRVELARLKLLKPALCALLQGAPEKLDFKDERPERWTRALDQQVDRVFFSSLWDDMDVEPEEADRRWDQLLIDRAWSLLQQATRSAPVPLARRYRAIAAAEGTFRGVARKEFPLANLSSLRSSDDDRPNPEST